MRAALGVIRKEGTLAAAVLVTAAAIRALGLDAQPLWWDEGWSVYFASLPVAEMADATASDIHPPLYYLVLHLWASLFGFTPTALRALSVVAGLATVWAGWRLGRRLLGPTAGLVTALLLALSPLQAFYSQEVRMYPLVTALGVLSWYALLRSEDERAAAASSWRGRAWPAAYVVVTALALYTEYYAALLWLGQAAYLLVSHRRAPFAALRSRLALLAGPPLLFLPWLVIAVPRLLAYVSQKQAIEGYRAFGPLAFAWDHLSAFAAGHTLAGCLAPLNIVIAVLFAGLAVIGSLAARRLRGAATALAAYGLLPLALGYVIHVLFPFTPPFYERVMLPFSPPFYLVVAMGLVHLVRPGPRWAAARTTLAAVALILPCLNLLPLWTAPRNQGSDYRPVFDLIRRAGSSDDVILCVHPWQYGYAVAYLPPRLRHPVLVPTDRWADPPTRKGELAALLDRSRALWFPSHESLGRILESEIAADLWSLAARAHAGWVDDETLLLAYAPARSDLVAGASAAFRDGPTLSASGFSPQAQAGGGTVLVDLRWRSAEPLTDLEASLRLVDEMGRTWATHDFTPEAPSERLALLVPWGTPAVPLRLTLTLSRDGAELEPETGLAGQRSLDLGRVELLPATEPLPSLADLGIAPFGARSDVGMALLGWELGARAATQGEELLVTLWWATSEPLAKEPIVFIQALAPDGRVIAATEQRITRGLWPPTSWSAGLPVRDPQSLLLPADAPAGQATLVAGLLDPDTRERLTLGSSDLVTLGPVQVLEAKRDFSLPEVVQTASVPFGDLATLVGYELGGCSDLDRDCLAGLGALEVRLVWRAQATTGTRYRSFVHLICDGEILAQSDQEPDGSLTTAWLPGQYVDDRHTIVLPNLDACSGSLSLQVGLYDPATSLRLAPQSGDQEDGKLILIQAQDR
ncbi:MAG: glycosyltransferase family 39 protein [Anaerolineae bacterium]